MQHYCSLVNVLIFRAVVNMQHFSSSLWILTTITDECGDVYSSTGDLYEYNSKSKPSWKRHIWQDKKAQVSSLMPSKGSTLHGLSADHSESLFLLTKVQ